MGARRGRRPYVYLVPGFFGFANLGELRYVAHLATQADVHRLHRQLADVERRLAAAPAPPPATDAHLN